MPTHDPTLSCFVPLWIMLFRHERHVGLCRYGMVNFFFGRSWHVGTSSGYTWPRGTCPDGSAYGLVIWPCPSMTRQGSHRARASPTWRIRPCLGCHLGTRHGLFQRSARWTWIVVAVITCIYMLLIVIYWWKWWIIGENDKIFQFFVKILMKISRCWFDGPWIDTARHENRPADRALGQRLGTKPVEA